MAERHEDPNDRRSKVVRLTARGVQVRSSVMRQLVVAPAFATLADQDLVALLALLRRISASDDSRTRVSDVEVGSKVARARDSARILPT